MTAYCRMTIHQSSNDNRSFNHCPDFSSIPDDLLVTIANQYLNPVERARLSSCNRRHNKLLPTPLRVKIMSSKGDASLQPDFFVSPVEEKGHYDYDNDDEDEDDDDDGLDHDMKYVMSHENLHFGKKYYFWTFDYERGNRVYLGRHTRHGQKPAETGDLRYMYTMGLRPYSPDQFWVISGGEDNDTVMWGDDIGLSVAGMNTKPRQPNSIQNGRLSCISIPSNNGTTATPDDEEETASSTATSGAHHHWAVLGNDDGPQEQLQLVPCPLHSPSEEISEQKLIIHAVPEVCDEGEYLLFSPKCQKNGEVDCEGYHVTVDFEFWVSRGIMHFYAPALPFALGIPILQTDDRCVGKSPLANLLEIKSARWGCVIYYMAVAADVSEGKALDMDRFLRRVTDHRDHSVHHDEGKKLVQIDVRNKSVRVDAPEIPRDTEAIWKFILAW